ncbi:MAG TPA: peptidylprolyl isomerase [Acidimicrobiales bacterium]|nr:peptidylprolyl isomerase [Acidimicrobiales bacterium]
MGTEKRQRQKVNRQQRLAAEATGVRRNQRRRRLFSAVAVSVVVFVALVLIAQTGGDDEQETAADPSTTTLASDPTTTTAAAPAAFEYGEGECPPAEKPGEPVLEFDGPPPPCIDPSRSYTAVFTTSVGEIRVALDTETTPGTTNNFVFLSRYGYYDGTRIHRTDPSIDIIQGGSPHTQSASDPGPGYTITDEGTTDRNYEAGDLVMARSQGPNSAGAQYFFVAGPAASALDSQGTYVTFGQVTEGLEVVQQILSMHQEDPNSQLGGAPDPPVTVESVEIIEG